MYLVQYRKGGDWKVFTSTANRERLPILMSLARITKRGAEVRWVRQ